MLIAIRAELDDCENGVLAPIAALHPGSRRFAERTNVGETARHQDLPGADDTTGQLRSARVLTRPDRTDQSSINTFTNGAGECFGTTPVRRVR